MEDEILQVMDLFAGAGGLSNGFEQTGKFKVKVAVEINENARKTYLANHPHIKEENFHKDITKLTYKDEKGNLKEEFGDIKVIIGGPPCQGFSNANRQKNTLISSNNQLVKQYIRAIEEILPKAFVMENVRTLESEKHKFFVSSEDEEKMLERLGVVVEKEEIDLGTSTKNSIELITLLNEAAYKKDDLSLYIINKDIFSKLNMLLRHLKKDSESQLLEFLDKENNKKFFSKIINKWQEIHKKYWDDATYFDTWIHLGQILKEVLEGYVVSTEEIKASLEYILETQRMINKISEINQNNIKLFGINLDDDIVKIKLRSYNVFKFLIAKFSSMGYILNDKDYIFNSAEFGVPQERRRLILIGVRESIVKDKELKIPKPLFKEGHYYKIQDAIGDIEELEPSTNVKDDVIEKGNLQPIITSRLNVYLNNNSNLLYNHVMTESREMALKRFESLTAGQNFHDLDESLKSTYSDYSRTQNTIYKRLDYEKPSDTVVNVRKSMWIHPRKNRAISIREAARLQSFQDTYRFYGTKDSQYQQVGNAVPPLMARFVAESLLETLGIEVEVKISDIIISETELITKS